MRAAAICISFIAVLVATTASAQMKSTAPEKMMPADESKNMRACDKKAMDEKIKVEDRADFVAKCMAEMKKAK